MRWRLSLTLGLFTLVACTSSKAERDASVDTGRDTDAGTDANVDGGSDASTDASPDAGSDADMDAGVDAGLCGDRWPDPIVDPPIITDSHYHFALRDIILGDGAGDVGWDLDRRCTMPGDDHRCTPPSADAPPNDGAGGSDNAFGQFLVPIINDASPGFEASVQERMTQGEALFIRLENWNLSPNDEDVEIVIYMTEGVAGGPRWLGDDNWIISATSSSIRDPMAHIANGVLVANIPNRQLVQLPWLDGGRLSLPLTDARLTATISSDTTLPIEDVWIQGRVSQAELARALDHAGICAGTELRTRLDAEIEQRLDVMSLVGAGGPGATCDAMSIAFSLTGTPATAGGGFPTDLVRPMPVSMCPAL